ncbi:Ankyrin repeat [Fusarium oxysporum f. sp. vasinfectum]|nr:Ankyrin repeat [Fusarium oxysporum f. sp. vasinfectum]
MKYALDALPSIYGTDTLAISFFFHGRGHELQRTPVGLFRSLLHQLLKRVPGAVPDLINHFEGKQTTEGEFGEKWQWHLQPLQALLKSSLPRILKRFPVMLFIDALDECGEQPAVELIGHLKHLLSSLPPTDSRFGIFFSCRHYPILELDGGLTILLDTENNTDITTYVQDRFSTDPDHYIESLISGRAQGVFMWAHLVVERVLRMKRRKEPRVEIEAAITQTPQNLDDLYHGLIQGVENRSVTLKLMQWICFSTRPLTASELRWAMAVDPNQTYKSLDECQGSKDFINDDDIDTRVMVLSCGLAEIVPSNNARIVQFIHQSVKDFFVERGLMALDNSTKEANLVVPVAHCRLSPNLHSLFQDGCAFSLPTIQPVRHIQVPFCSLCYEIIDVSHSVGQGGRDIPKSGTKLIHVISRYGLTKLASCLLQDSGEIGALNVQDSWGRTPLSWAAENGSEAVVKMLLDTGKGDVDSRDKNGRSPLSLAAKSGHEAIVRLLVDTGKADMAAEDLLDFIIQSSTPSSRVKWIISSRNWPDIEDKLDSAKQKVRLPLELNKDSISKAVDTYISYKVDRLACHKKYDKETRDAVENYLTSNADGTFLWVALVCQELADPKVRKRHTLNTLKSFPPGLDSLYDRMIAHIGDSKDAGLCKEVLAIASVVYRPITLEELQTNSLLSTDIGLLNLDLPALSPAIDNGSTNATLQSVRHSSWGISTDSVWIVKDEKGMLWLPPEYRVMKSAVVGSTVAIGCHSGRVLLMKFS